MANLFVRSNLTLGQRSTQTQTTSGHLQLCFAWHKSKWQMIQPSYLVHKVVDVPPTCPTKYRSILPTSQIL